MNAEEIIMEASKLAQEEQASIASRILRGLDCSTHAVSDDEVGQRMNEAELDSSVLLSFDDFVAGVNRREG